MRNQTAEGRKADISVLEQQSSRNIGNASNNRIPNSVDIDNLHEPSARSLHPGASMLPHRRIISIGGSTSATGIDDSDGKEFTENFNNNIVYTSRLQKNQQSKDGGIVDNMANKNLYLKAGSKKRNSTYENVGSLSKQSSRIVVSKSPSPTPTFKEVYSKQGNRKVFIGKKYSQQMAREKVSLETQELKIESSSRGDKLHIVDETNTQGGGSAQKSVEGMG